MKAFSESEKSLVVPVEVSVNPVTAEAPSLITGTVVLASKTGTPIPALEGEVAPMMADGSLYGINVGNGTIVWRRFLGYQTTIQPQN